MAVVTQTIQDNVTELYIGFFGRAPDAAGFGYWTNRLAQGDVTIQQISKAFAATPEFVSNYNGLTPTQQVTKVYANVLGRAPDAGGLAYWVGQITTGTQSIADVVWNVTNSAFIQTGTADGLLVQNKVTVGEYFAITLASNDTASAATAYNLVTSNPASIAQAEATLVSATYTLTTSIDTISPKAYSAVNGLINVTSGSTDTTLNAADSITGTAPVTMNVTMNGSVITSVANGGSANRDATNGASITGVTTYNIRNATTDVAGTTTGTNVTVATLDASGIASLTNVNSDRSTGTVTVTNLAAGAAGGVLGNGTLSNGNSNFGYVATATSATVNVSGGVKAGTVTTSAASGTALVSQTVNSTGGVANKLGALTLGANVTTLNINAATDLTTGGITNTSASALKTLTITGAGAVDASGGQLGTTVTTVNASANSGGVSVVLGTGITAFTGGTGNDVVETAATTTATAVINGGTGTDTLVLAATNDVTTAAKAAQYTGFEILRSKVTSAPVDVSLFSGITTLQTSGNASFLKMTAGQAANIQVLSTNAAPTFTLADASGTGDVIGLNLQALKATDAATPIDATGLVLAGFETLNVTASSGLQSIYSSGTTLGTIDSVSLGSNTSPTLKTVNLNGGYAVDFDGSAAGGVAITSINSSGNTAGAVIKTGGQTGALVVTGSNAASQYSLGSMGTGGTQSIIGGTSNDKFSGAYAAIAAATIAGGTGIDTLAFTDTTDSLTVADAAFRNISGIDKVTFASTTGGVSWTVGGYTNTLATNNNGVLDITLDKLVNPDVAATATIPVSGNVSVDASGLSGTNSLKISITETLSTTAVAGSGAATGDISITSSTGGADNITITTTGGTTNITSGGISVDGSGNTSSGITINTSAVAAALTSGKSIALKGGSGADTIIGGALAESFTGNAGHDVITGGGGSDKFVYQSKATSVGIANVDYITDFDGNGSSSPADAINIAAGTGTFFAGLTLTTSTTNTIGTAVTSSVSVNSIDDVYAAILANAAFASGNFAASNGTSTGGLQAKTVTFSNGSFQGAYLIVNDAYAGFQADADFVVKLAGTSLTNAFATSDLAVV